MQDEEKRAFVIRTMDEFPESLEEIYLAASIKRSFIELRKSMAACQATLEACQEAVK